MSTLERSARDTHEVANQAPPLQDVNLYALDRVLREAVEREGGGWAAERLHETGRTAGSAEAIEHGKRADRNTPRLVTHDRYGHRVNEVEFRPDWHG